MTEQKVIITDSQKEINDYLEKGWKELIRQEQELEKLFHLTVKE